MTLPFLSSLENPLSGIENYDKNKISNRLLGYFFAEITLWKDLKFKTGKNGTFEVTVDILNLTVSFNRTGEAVYENLYIIGDATSGGWALENAGKMEEISDGVYKWSGQLGTGKFRFVVSTAGHAPGYWKANDNPEDMGIIFSNALLGGDDDRAFTITEAGGYIITADTAINLDTVIPDLAGQLEAMDVGPLLGLWLQSIIVSISLRVLALLIMLITFGRMIEIYLVSSIAPIPMAAMMGREFGGMGQNYLRTLLALGFQAFLIIICVAIYAVLVQGIAAQADVSAAMWSCMGYTVLLCFTLFKTGSLSKALFSAH